ncbi:hypothetical protein WR25_14785 [Diploscapter pachys]|uniref:C2H2-type domain-containing protein n=1 Tax=Diploscapter pachys TaxID=2018661 RepID=A0A2A2LI58_9BILA|nr:hypothetical protein WR25_14785 [Diploscapter pachys]
MNYGEELAGFSFYIVELKRPPKKVQHARIEGIRKLHEFTFDSTTNKVRVWRHWQVGAGKQLKTDKWKANESELHIVASASRVEQLYNDAGGSATSLKSFQMSIFVTTRARKIKDTQLPSEVNTKEEDDNAPDVINDNDFDDLATLQKQNGYYHCPEPGCIKRYRFLGGIRNHQEKGNHRYAAERCTLKDFSIRAFIEESKTLNLDRAMASGKEAVKEKTKGDVDKPTQEMGFALEDDESKDRRFDEDQTKFLTGLFLIGKKTGNNIDPKRASEMMKTERDANGKRRFKRDQFLTTSQIKSWFGARARTEKRLIEEKQKKEDQNRDKKQGRGKTRAERETTTDKITETMILAELKRELEELEGSLRDTMEMDNFFEDNEEILERMVIENKENIFIPSDD